PPGGGRERSDVGQGDKPQAPEARGPREEIGVKFRETLGAPGPPGRDGVVRHEIHDSPRRRHLALGADRHRGVRVPPDPRGSRAAPRRSEAPRSPRGRGAQGGDRAPGRARLDGRRRAHPQEVRPADAWDRGLRPLRRPDGRDPRSRQASPPVAARGDRRRRHQRREPGLSRCRCPTGVRVRDAAHAGRAAGGRAGGVPRRRAPAGRGVGPLVAQRAPVSRAGTRDLAHRAGPRPQQRDGPDGEDVGVDEGAPRRALRAPPGSARHERLRPARARGRRARAEHAAGPRGRLAVREDDPRYTLRRVWLTAAEEHGYYYGFANEGLWPLCHIVHTRPVFRPDDWASYLEANRRFAGTVLDEIKNAEEP